MPAKFSNADDIIDIRDIIDRVETLEELRQPGPVDLGDEEDNAADQDSLFAELAALETLMAALCGTGGDEQWRGDWDPVTLIRDSHFETYAQELAEDIGAIPSDAKWPCTCIDWEQAARELRMDYTSVEFDGITYWVR
jgi:hypothetical protein